MNYTSNTNLTFKEFLFTNRRNRWILYIAGITMVMQFIIFKYYYPYANFIHNESFTFIDAAASNADISTYPIGYSKFLRIFNTFTKSDTALVAFQYLFLQVSTLFLLFTLFYFHRITKATQYILCGFMILNPLFLYLANLVSPDAIFAAVSLSWFALLLWIIHRPHKRVILWQAIAITIAFTISYKALLYPVISAGAFWISPRGMQSKIRSWGLGALLCFLFFSYTGYKYQLLTGRWQFTPYLGWLMANNALIAYREVTPQHYKPYNSIPYKFKIIDTITRLYFKQPRNTVLTPAWEKAGIQYMLNNHTPLVNYRDSFYNKEKDTSAISSLKAWAKLGPLYKEYGWFTVKDYPKEYINYVIGINLRKYFAPPTDFLDNFNNGSTFVKPAAHMWFDYKRNIITPRYEIHNDNMLSFYPYLSAIFNLLLLLGLIYYLLLRGKEYEPFFNKTILFTGISWLLNVLLTVCLTASALRSQVFSVLITIIFSGLLIDWMCRLISITKAVTNKSIREVNQPTISAASHV